MKRLIILSIAIFLLAFTGSFATMTRVLTMGDANGIVHDEANIWYFPSTLYDYPEMAIGEFSLYNYYDEDYYEDFTDIGVHYKFGEKKPFVLGVYFTRQQPYSPNVYIPWGWQFSVPDNKRIDLFYARMLGNHKFGLHFNYIHSSSKYENDTTAAGDGSINHSEEGITSYSFNLGLTPNNGNFDLAAGIKLLTWTDKNWRGEDETKPDGNIALDVLARYFYQVDQKVTLVPYAGFMTEKQGVKLFGHTNYPDTLPDTFYQKNSITYSTIALGLGLNYTPAAGILAIGDFGIMLDKSHYKYEPMDTGDYIEEDKYDYTTVPYFRVGIDAVVFKWMDLRLGGTSYWQSYKQDYEYTRQNPYTFKYRQSYVSNDTYLGAGFHWGNFYADTYINPSLITNGFNFISGESEPMNFQVSLKYKMF
jgi:hypothetical protein